jgi:hypothetical protein
VLPPRQPRGEARREPLRGWELDPPLGVAGLAWILLTNVPIHSVADAFERVDW